MEIPKRQSTCLLTDKNKAWKCLAGIKLSSLQPNVVAEDFYEEPEKIVEKNEPDVYTVSKSMTCSLCNCKFEDRHQQKEHYRLDWHRFNLKQRMLGLKSVSEDVFSQQADDVSSISGSGDSSSEEDETDMSPISHQSPLAPGRRKKSNSFHKYDSDDDDEDDAQKKGGDGRRCPRIYFENDEGQVVSLFRCIVHGKREAPTNHTDLISRSLGLLANQKWAFMMTGGGHFAAAIYDGPEVIVHKTFHRYTVRAKRGTVQSVRDAQGGTTCKSAGAAIRRHNEAALNEEVQNLLASWKDHLDACSRIFLRVHTYNRPMFYSGKNPALVKGDDRVVTVPFATRRATFKEVKRVWEVLATIECHGNVEEVKAAMANPKEKREWKKKSPSKDKGRDTFQEDDDDGSVEVILRRLDEQSLEDGSSKDATDNSSTVKTNDNQNEIEKDDEEEDVVELHEEVVITSTDHLKEYETSHKKPRRRRKKKEQNKVAQEDEEEANLTTELFTICRTGNMDKFEEVLQKVQEHFRTPPQNPNHSVPSSHENLPGGHGEVNDRPSKNPTTIPDNENKDNKPSSADNIEGTMDNSNCNSIVCNPNDGNTDDSNNRRHIGESEPRLSESLDNVSEFLKEEDKNVKDELVEFSSTKPNFPNVSESTKPSVPDEKVPDCEVPGVETKCPEDWKKPSPGVIKFLNKPIDDMGYTFLHVATEDGQRRVLYRLMECGADPGIKNKKGKPAYGCSLDKKTREEFKRFRSDYPDRYDYTKAQIPEPLTEEQEKEKAAKQAERKRNARKVKRQKEKEQKIAKEEERKVKEEEMKENKKKEWFANLSDREKRALAAEKRFAMQTTSSSDMQRCWGCGSSLTSKVPFSYMEFKFCSMPCLKKHKQQQQS